MKKKYLSIIFFTALILGLLVINIKKPSNSAPDTNTQDQTQESISLTITDEDNSEIYQTSVTEGTVYDLLKNVAIDNNIELTSKDYDFGVFVESIDGKESTAEKSWIYFVNGESGQVGADKFELKAGDKVEWKYITPTQ